MAASLCRVEFAMVDGVAHAAASELHVERHRVERGVRIVRGATRHEQVLVLLDGRATVRDDAQHVAIGPGDGVVVPAHTAVVVEFDGPAELLVVRRAGDEPVAGHEPSHWFG
jgi:mannose-6-phosphate isomerase-like protein (cupin superfamily)